MNPHLLHLRCNACGARSPRNLMFRCPTCADGGALRFVYDTAALAPFDRSRWARREPWLWRFRELLPFDDLQPAPLQVGMTPLYGSVPLAERCGVRGLFVKDESRNPTGRVADRAASLTVSDASARDGGQAMIAAELGPSVAAFAASVQFPAVGLLRPGDDASELGMYGAGAVVLGPELDVRQTLLRLREDCFSLGEAPNALAFEGLKTLGLELGDQLAERLPDWICVDARVPDLAEAVGAGLQQCAELGLFARPPKVLAVGGAGGDAQVALDEKQLPRCSAEARHALGLPISEQGAAALAGLAAAVEQGLVPREALALVVVEGALRPEALPAGKPLPHYADVLAAARALARRR